MTASHPEALLCVANFPAGTGFAWRFIEQLWEALGHRASQRGLAAYVAYPELSDSSVARLPVPVRLDASCATLKSVLGTAWFIRRHRVRWLYLTDRPATHWSYAALRLAGARRIVVHDHTSGARIAPRGPKRWMKWFAARLPGLAADRVLGVSDFVVKRQIEVGQVPASRVQRVWNGVPLGEVPAPSHAVHQELGLDPNVRLVVCASRATPEKGIRDLMRAFDRVASAWPEPLPPALVYIGDGPEISELRALAASLPSGRHIHVVGYRDNPTPYYLAATLCVYPSRWEEAFGLGVLEAMSLGRAVLATRVGGIPEIIEDGISGILVPPGDVNMMTEALRELLLDAERRGRLAEAGRNRARSCFRLSDTVAAVVKAVLLELG